MSTSSRWTPRRVAKIFDTKIKKWNDPAIAKLNDGVKLPDKAIQAFRRSEEDSGTTQNLGKYLGAASPERLEVRGRGKKWPAPVARPRPAPPASPPR
ncbi:hypothetical protein SALBM217S_07472 [Streptomyces griseoloalbus]